MKYQKSIVSSSVALVLGVSMLSPATATVLTFADNTSPATFASNPDAIGASNTSALPSGNEFRMIDPSGAGGGGPPQPAKDIITGGETWSFDGASNLMNGTGGTPGNPGAGAFAGSAAPTANTNPTTGQPAPFFFQGFNFLAPTTGSLAGAAYGAASITASFTGTSATTGTMTIDFPTLEAQWGGVWFPLGQNFTGTDTAGVTLSGSITCANTSGPGTACSFRLQGQETINNAAVGTNVNEDPSAAGFGNWTAQWDLVGTADDLSQFAPSANQPPVASAGSDQMVSQNATVNLDGSASTDADGTIDVYAWTQTAGAPTVTLTGANSATPSFTAPATATTLTFELTVTDNDGATATDTVDIVVTGAGGNLPPTADAGSTQTVTQGDTVNLDGSASTDADGTIDVYAWTQTAGITTVTLTGADTATPSFTAPTGPDTLTFELTVTDNDGGMSTDMVDITVSAPVNQPPTADAGSNQVADEGDNVTLDGSASTDADGTIDVYAWMQTAGPTVTLNGASTVTPSFIAPAGPASLTFQLQVTDNSGATDTATVSVSVNASSGGAGNNIVLTFHNRGAADLEDRYSLPSGTYANGVFSPASPPNDEPFTVTGGTTVPGLQSEYRMLQPPSGSIGASGEKSLAGRRDSGSGSDSDVWQWIFDSNGLMSDGSGFVGTDATPPATNDIPVTDQGAHYNAEFFGAEFGFQIPPGSSGQADIDLVNNTMTIAWSEGLWAHWSTVFFPLGSTDPANECHTDGQGCGITMRGVISNVVSSGGTTTFDFKLFGEHRITPYENTEGNTGPNNGFTAWIPQWELDGTGVMPTPVQIESPSASSGTLAPTPGGAAEGNSFDDGRTTRDELTAAGIPDDDGVTQACIGSCFDFTVSGIAPGSSVQVILPLSSPLTSGAVYRKFINGAWQDFDTSAIDTIESASSGAGTCAALTDVDFSSGLTQGDDCIRLSIIDGGPNDSDGTVNGSIQDPSGAGVPTDDSELTNRPSQSIGTCSILAGGEQIKLSRAVGDGALLLAFLTWLGWRRKAR